MTLPWSQVLAVLELVAMEVLVVSSDDKRLKVLNGGHPFISTPSEQL